MGCVPEGVAIHDEKTKLTKVIGIDRCCGLETFATSMQGPGLVGSVADRIVPGSRKVRMLRSHVPQLVPQTISQNHIPAPPNYSAL